MVFYVILEFLIVKRYYFVAIFDESGEKIMEITSCGTPVHFNGAFAGDLVNCIFTDSHLFLAVLTVMGSFCTEVDSFFGWTHKITIRSQDKTDERIYLARLNGPSTTLYNYHAASENLTTLQEKKYCTVG